MRGMHCRPSEAHGVPHGSHSGCTEGCGAVTCNRCSEDRYDSSMSVRNIGRIWVMAVICLAGCGEEPTAGAVFVGVWSSDTGSAINIKDDGTFIFTYVYQQELPKPSFRADSEGTWESTGDSTAILKTKSQLQVEVNGVSKLVEADGMRELHLVDTNTVRLLRSTEDRDDELFSRQTTR